jgi:DinB family protein
VNRSPLQDAIAEVLRQGESLLNSLSDGEYTRKLPNVFGSTVGGHYRHCLDHFKSLLLGLDADEINYDHRQRDPRIENDRTFALAETHRILRAFASIPTPFLDCPINVRSKINYELDAASSIGSTVGRELMYAVAHAIHHYALIAVMCGMLQVRVPAGFGVAPSTLKYHAEQPKAA